MKLLLCLLMVSAVFARTGKIAGTVVDSSGKGVVGAGILILETKQGAFVSNTDGSFVILGVAPGLYTVSVMNVGYATLFINHVAVAADQTTLLHTSLAESLIPISCVVEYRAPHRSNDNFRTTRCPSCYFQRNDWPPDGHPEFRVEPRHRHYLTQPSGRDVF